jgi:hypothetical protein
MSAMLRPTQQPLLVYATAETSWTTIDDAAVDIANVCNEDEDEYYRTTSAGEAMNMGMASASASAFSISQDSTSIVEQHSITSNMNNNSIA